MLNTLMHTYPVHKGSQSVLYDPRDEQDGLRTLVTRPIPYKGV
jgi:hypothetical protein